MQIAGRVQVPERGRQVETEEHHVPRGQAARVIRDEPGQRRARERLQDQGRSRAAHQLVGANEMRMRKAQQQPRFEEERQTGLAVPEQIAAHRFRDAAAPPLFAPGIVHVERMAATQQAQGPVAPAERPSSRERGHLRRIPPALRR